MSYHVLVNLLVLDEKRFQQYYESLAGLLARHEGEINYELNLPDSLLSRRSSNFNRVVAMQFSCKARMEEFFADHDYKMTRGRHVLKSFASGEIVFGYEREPVSVDQKLLR